MNWTGLARSLQPGIIGSIGSLLVILIAWLAIRFNARRTGPSLGKRSFANGTIEALSFSPSPSPPACSGRSPWSPAPIVHRDRTQTVRRFTSAWMPSSESRKN